ncbi:MAG TPA: hypothetical protein VGN26_05925 [Armatimonadota bacterium]
MPHLPSKRRRFVPSQACLLGLALVTIGLSAPRAAHAAADVLILSTSVTGGAASREAQQVTALGMTFDLVTAVQWGAMTTADFAQYKAIVLGDPTCSISTTSIAAAEANKAVWSPAITGNVIVIGTDPTFHSAGQPGAVTLINRGINFAAAEPGHTGLYACLSCYYHDAASGTPVSVLSGISGGGFTVVGQGGCPAVSHIVATHPALTGLTDAALSNWSCSAHEGFVVWPSDFLVLVLSKDIPSPFVAADGTTGAPYILARGKTLVVISDIKLTPISATNPVGTSHTVTATVTSGGSPVVGTTVTFTVTSGPNAGVTGTAATNASGVATFTYTDAGGAGTDTIEAKFTDASGKVQTSNKATKEWVASTTDTTPPACALTAIVAGPPKQIIVTLQDTGSGLATITATVLDNVTLSIPLYAPGTTAPVVVTATKIDQTKAAHLALHSTDVAGNATDCDPVLADLQIPDGASSVTQTFTGLPLEESFVTLRNGIPGVKMVQVQVNGRKAHLLRMVGGALRMTGPAVRTLSVKPDMLKGDTNSFTVTAYGEPGSLVSLIIGDDYADTPGPAATTIQTPVHPRTGAGGRSNQR